MLGPSFHEETLLPWRDSKVEVGSAFCQGIVRGGRMTVFSSKGPGPTTNPDGRYGRKPRTVRMNRCGETLTLANRRAVPGGGQKRLAVCDWSIYDGR